MKQLTITIISILLLGITGCSEDNNIVTPNENEDQLHSTEQIEPNWIEAPEVEAAIGKTFIATQFITKKDGGEIKLVKEYRTPNGPHEKIKIDCSLKFEKRTVYRNCRVTWTYDTDTGISYFGPSQKFRKKAILNIKCEGLPLIPTDENNLKFYYLTTDDSGNPKWEFIKSEDLDINVEKGFLNLKNAKIPHFSRYGFAR